MIADALKFLCDLGEKAGVSGRAAIVPDPSVPGGSLVLSSDGGVRMMSPPVVDRTHTLQSIDQFGQILELEKDPLLEGKKPCVFVGTDDCGNGLATLVFDASAGSNRRSRATCRMDYTHAYSVLFNESWYSQRDMRSILMDDLSDCGVPAKLLNWVSSVRFASKSESRGTITAGKESLGRDLELEADSAGEPAPEFVELSVRVFQGRATSDRYPIKCRFVVDVEERRMRLVPVGDIMARTVEKALADVIAIIQTIVGDEVPVIYGLP